MKETLPVHHRPQWKSHIGFLLAAIGSAIGLGNVWRFPYLCYENGGGAFLIPYFLALFLVGLPLMILEIGLGHKMRGSAPASYYEISKHWEWLGWWQVIFVMFGIVLYYSVVIAWCLNYLFFSFNLSWGENPNNFFFNKFLMVSKGPFNIGDIRTLILFALFVIWFLNWLIVFSGIEKGLERANKIFMPLLFILTAILVFWSLRLPGASSGLKVYLKPDFSQLKNPKVWIDAFSQIFFTLSLGFGIMIAYASYLPKKSQILKDSIAISFTNCFYSVFAGLGVFSVLGYMSHVTQKPLEEVVSKGAGLAFIAYPKAISLLPAFQNLFGVVFFAILVIAGLSSSVSILEAFTSAIIDKFQYKRKVVVSVLSILGFLGSVIFTTQAGIHWLEIVDHFLTTYGLLTAGFLECILIGWIYKTHRLREHINHVSVFKLSKIWDFCIRVVCPLVLATLLFNSLVKEFKQPYGGYSILSLIILGRDWLIFTLFLALLFSFRPWRLRQSINKS